MGHTRRPSPEAPTQSWSCLSQFFPVTESKIHSQAAGPQGHVEPLSVLGTLGTGFPGKSLSSLNQPDPETAASFRRTSYDHPATVQGFLFHLSG